MQRETINVNVTKDFEVYCHRILGSPPLKPSVRAAMALMSWENPGMFGKIQRFVIFSQTNTHQFEVTHRR